jgi:hypothetical protein
MKEQIGALRESGASSEEISDAKAAQFAAAGIELPEERLFDTTRGNDNDTEKKPFEAWKVVGFVGIAAAVYLVIVLVAISGTPPN